MKRTMGECIEAFLSLAILRPENPPRTQRAERDNQMMIIGYNRAQEDLRKILEAEGKTLKCRELAQVRHPDQVRPLAAGNLNLWVAS